ncbi:DUF4082 domain-containing protein [Microbacterium protaetiae]|uniref:DUF4082 domain-containing protein n=1 Tax=Microbacterium protaetiae TaxID=2509458 RepID=UPI001F5D4F24|nr:DUF4082 domain-containing protein [Microbacterium protaetiae]
MLATVSGGLVAIDAVQPEPAAAAGSSCGADVNPIVCENEKPGTDPDVWDIDGAGDTSIQGFSTDISVNAGSTIDFKIDTDASAYTIDIYRTGWYQGDGARFIQSIPVTATLPQIQPECISDVTTELYDCGTWGVSASWDVPSDAVSGVYFALLRRTDTGGESQIVFVVRNDGNHSDIVFQTSDSTWQAYNPYGGSDFYQGAANGRAYKISYNRPIVTRGTIEKRSFYFSSEFATVKFLERNGYDVSYMAAVDVDRYGSQLLNHEVYLSVGHDEYWSAAQRQNVEDARDAGVNLQFLSGNEMYWHTRYEASVDGSDTPYRTLVSYKETWGNSANRDGGKIDSSTTEWTGTWRDPRFADASEGGTLPENALTGTMYMVNDDDLAVTVSAAEGKLRLWRDTSLADLAAGTSAELAPHTIGYESDEDVDNGFRPAGLIHLSTTVGPTPQYLQDYGNVATDGTTEHHLTMYRAASGALVFSAGSVGWAWGLADDFDGSDSPPDPRMQQAQVNLFADMGVQPQTLMSGLVQTTESTDTTAPTTVIASPTSGASIPNGTSVTVTGTASDTQGVVAGVEISTDGGTSWHPATGTSTWTYTYIQQGSGSANIMARGIDDSGNFSSAGTSVTVSVGGPYSAFGDATPPTASADDPAAVELGVQFTPTSDGYVTGVRFYKGEANTGTHVGSLWDSTGQRLGSVTFTDETSSGWQQALFSSPIEVVAGQKYTVSYTAPNGGYAAQTLYWPYDARESSPVSVASGVGSAAPGVFAAPGEFPTSTWHETNYYVDVLFDTIDNSPLRILSTTPVEGSSSNPVDGPVSVVFSRDVDRAALSFVVTNSDGSVVDGAVTYDSDTRTATFTPASSLNTSATYTVSVTAKDANGVGLADGTHTWKISTAAAVLPDGTCPCSLFTDLRRPDIASAADTDAVTLGVKFSSAEAGTITALRFYKGAGNGGSHTGTLWSDSGNALATVTFDDESTVGWQTATLSTPVSISAGKTYVVSYTAPYGGYAVSSGIFSTAYSRGPLTVPVNGGVYTYAGGFPSQSSTTEYAVDVVFEPLATGPAVVKVSPVAGDAGVETDAAVTVTFDAKVTAATLALSSGGAAIPGTVALSADGLTATFTPSNALPTAATITAALSGVTGANGGVGADKSWSFATIGASGDTVVTMFDGPPSASAVTATDDPDSVILGMSFTTSVQGQVRALRFYKSAGNTGTHIGWLWGSGSTPLATVTFTNESDTGWQRASLSTPVDLVPGQTYTVSYLAPNGNYTYQSGAFADPVTSGPLTAVSPNNGTFVYGSSGRPTSSWNSTNYFVDVEFTASVDGVVDTLFNGVTPSVTAEADSDAIEVGTAFTVSEAGEVQAIRFYKGSGNTGTHVGTLWTADGVKLATVTFDAESDSGWQRAALASPVAVSPGQTYVVSYFAPNGHYAAQSKYFATERTSGRLTGIATQNGRYLYGGSGGFPTDSFQATAYFVDVEVLFSDQGAGSGSTSSPSPSPSADPAPSPSPDPTESPDPSDDTGSTDTSGTTEPTDTSPEVYYSVTAHAPDAGNDVAPTTTVTTTFASDPGTANVSVSSGTTPVAGTTVYDSDSKTVTFTPTEPLAWSTAYDVTITVDDATVSDGTWSFTTADAPAVETAQTIFGDSLPANAWWDDPDAVQVATRFTVDAGGEATGVRFYKGSANTGQHTGYLWNADGTQLAEIQFTGETADGWQTAQFAEPVELEPDVEYRVGLYSTTGRYAVDIGTLAKETTVGPFTIPASGSAWIYSTDFPSNVSTNNYWVDVLYTPAE